jgi:hypothetical protein
MFHVVTVHWRSESWIEPQMRFIRRFLPPDTRVYASLNGIDPARRSLYAFADDLPGSHAEKLNELARIAIESAAPDDYLVFLDGDALPIAPITPEILGGTQLAAVRRDENLHDPQPHPCFCVTTTRFWKEIDGDWRAGYIWVNSLGYRTSDVGANLLGQLEARHEPWRPLLRSNRVDIHPLWFAIYGDVVYHQGAGFRSRLERSTLDLRHARVPSWLPLLRRLDKRLAMRTALRRRHDDRPQAEEDGRVAAEILAAIQRDDDFLAPLFGRPAGQSDSR